MSLQVSESKAYPIIKYLCGILLSRKFLLLLAQNLIEDYKS